MHDHDCGYHGETRFVAGGGGVAAVRRVHADFQPDELGPRPDGLPAACPWPPRHLTALELDQLAAEIRRHERFLALKSSIGRLTGALFAAAAAVAVWVAL